MSVFILKLRNNKIKKNMRKLVTCTFLNNASDAMETLDSPLQMKLISYLGLKKYMIDNFVFKRKPSNYAIRKKDGVSRLFMDAQYSPPNGYKLHTTILETSGNSVPIARLIPKTRNNNCTIVYAHGNASDMTDSLAFVEMLSQLIQAEYVIFDYTGYGESRVPEVGEEIICKDMQIVLAWLTKKRNIQDIILWGFSLGTFPVVHAASKYPVKGVVLQCPIASVSCIFYEQLHPDMKFQQDYFANLQLIEEVKSKILILHSSADEIIPINHAKILFQKYIRKNGQKNIDFVEVSKIKHNSLHRYIVSQQENALQKQVFSFLLDLIYAESAKVSLSVSLANSETKTESVIQKARQKQVEKGIVFCQMQELDDLRIRIMEAEIEELPEDMDELVVDEVTERVSPAPNSISKRLMKDCFCFSNEGEAKIE